MANLIYTVNDNNLSNFKSAARVPIKNLKVYFNPTQEGSGTPSLDNIRFISGHNKITTYICGKNMFDGNFPNIDGDNVKYRSIYVGNRPVTVSTTCTDNTVGYSVLYAMPGIVATGADTARNGIDNTLSRTIEPVNGYITIAYRVSYNVDPRNFLTQIEVGPNATKYEPYTNETYEINFPSEVGMAYTGYVDLIKGKLVLTHKLYTITGQESNAKWSWNGYLIPKSDSVSSNAQIYVSYCSHTDDLASGSYFYNTRESTIEATFIMCAASAGNQLRFRNRYVTDAYSTNEEKLAAMRTWLQEQYANGTPVQIIYQLENPETINLTDSFNIKTFLGVNNIWSDNNKSVEVSYGIHDSETIWDARKRILAAAPHLITVVSGNINDSLVIAHFNTDLAAPMKSFQLNFNPIQWGKDAVSIDNVRTLHGWDSLPIHIAGRNLLLHGVTGSGTFVRTSFQGNEDGSITLTRDTVGGAHIAINNIHEPSRTLYYQNDMKKCLPAGEYIVRNTYSNGEFGYLLQFHAAYDNTYSFGSSAQYTQMTQLGIGNVTLNITQDHIYTLCRVYSGGSSYSTGSTIMYPAVFLASETDTSYEKFKGYTTNISLPTTLYSGYIDLVKGEIVADTSFIIIDGANLPVENFYTETDRIRLYTAANSLSPYADYGANKQAALYASNMLCTENGTSATTNILPSISIGQYNSQAYISLPLNFGITDISSANTWLSEHPVLLIYKLQTPIHYSVTPINLKTLRGINNVWSDAGTVSLQYWAH